MAQVGTNATGQPVYVGDQCTITGRVASISGSGFAAVVTVTTDKSDSINVAPSDLISTSKSGPYTNTDSTLPTVQSNDGQLFGTLHSVSVRGTVNGYVSGAGSTSLLSVKLANSGALVTVTAATLRSAPSQAGNLV